MSSEPLPLGSDGLFQSADMSAAGRRAELAKLRREGSVEQVTRGVYCPAPATPEGTHDAAQDADRYRRLVLAKTRRLQEPIFTSYSAVALHELPIIGRWPDVVYRLRRGPTGTRYGSIVGVACRHDVEPVLVEGHLTTPLELTLIQLARHAPLVTALTAWNAALWNSPVTSDRPMTTLERLRGEHARLLPYHRSARVAAVLDRASPLSGSVLETLSGVTIEELGFAQPVRQARIVLPELASEAYLDFLSPEQNIGGEADGDSKYVDFDGGAAHAAHAVLAEKRREDAIRHQLSGLVRWNWADAWNRRPLARRLHRAGVPRVGPVRRLR